MVCIKLGNRSIDVLSLLAYLMVVSFAVLIKDVSNKMSFLFFFSLQEEEEEIKLEINVLKKVFFHLLHLRYCRLEM